MDIQHFFSPESLASNFLSLLNGHYDVIKQRHRIAIGADRIGLQLFQRDLDKHLRAIQRKVLQGRYTFSPSLQFQIPKVDSKEKRTISIATIRDTIVQRALYKHFYDRIDSKLTDSVFGYRRGRSAHDAVQLIRQHFSQGRTAVFDADLTKFFDRVDHDTLMSRVHDLNDIDPIAAKLVFRFLKTGSVPSEQVAIVKNTKGNEIKYNPLARSEGVPQGGVLSGMLSNLYLAEFDHSIRADYPGFVRYADDFVICCESEAMCKDAKQKVVNLLPKGAELNLKKTIEHVSAETGVDFLGFRISTRKLRVRGRNVGKFKKRISDLIAKHSSRTYHDWERALKHLIENLTFKIEGPTEEQLQNFADLGFSVARYRRSWIGFFRIVDDLEQIRQIDKWVRQQIKSYVWKKFKVKVSRTELQNLGLPTLVNTKFKAQKSKLIAPNADNH